MVSSALFVATAAMKEDEEGLWLAGERFPQIQLEPLVIPIGNVFQIRARSRLVI